MSATLHFHHLAPPPSYAPPPSAFWPPPRAPVPPPCPLGVVSLPLRFSPLTTVRLAPPFLPVSFWFRLPPVGSRFLYPLALLPVHVPPLIASCLIFFCPVFPSPVLPPPRTPSVPHLCSYLGSPRRSSAHYRPRACLPPATAHAPRRLRELRPPHPLDPECLTSCSPPAPPPPPTPRLLLPLLSGTRFFGRRCLHSARSPWALVALPLDLPLGSTGFSPPMPLLAPCHPLSGRRVPGLPPRRLDPLPPIPRSRLPSSKVTCPCSIAYSWLLPGCATAFLPGASLAALSRATPDGFLGPGPTLPYVSCYVFVRFTPAPPPGPLWPFDPALLSLVSRPAV
ncbi:unnamed protein product [Prunus armeniaca]|uniref:Uncharacterized protein n=1 Tax=Prunus armeniaca TaxID=36596 RepID=A0A6J5V6T0_PRUAR|nr:unnamed protein product [Prunus armeniaca]CAB4283438.1 unnamed protein product [Prunus armeniaca]